MGSFSWLKADGLTKVANIVAGRPFKLLIPKEFGGGYIIDRYQDYGRLGRNELGQPKYDMYELLAFWNWEQVAALGYTLHYDGDFSAMKEIDRWTSGNRVIGIRIGCSNGDVDRLKYPLKLVSVSYKGTYEDLDSRSYGDPNQGFSPLYRANM